MADKEKLVSQLARISATYTKLGEEIAALTALVDDAPTEGQLAKRLLDYFVRAWTAKYRAQFVVNGARDMMTFKRLLKASLDVDDLEQRIGRYLADDDPFWKNAKHPIGMFATAVNRLGRRVPISGSTRVDDDDFLQAAPVDCRHSPPCRDDVAHTRRKQQEARA